ncbi:MAG: class II glutamine amidotransferase [Euryarchaeota archaeon]|nr:class II glutamine amidotransferase [Euryarchaeota archaeon]
MCRLFGMLSARDAEGTKWLVDDRCSLLAQSDADPKRLQKDGWGVAHFSNGSFRLLQSTGSVFRERERFREAARSAFGNAVLAHIRKASNPNKLPESVLGKPENIQPFFAEGWAFAHNGTVYDKDNEKNKGSIAKGLGAYRKCIGGKNDSEVLFWHFIKAASETRDIPSALRTMERRIVKYGKNGKPYTALNVIVTNGRAMYAYCKFTGQPAKFPRSICLGKQGYYTMCYREESGRVVAMSEMSNAGRGWKIMENGEILTVNVWNGKLETLVI